MEQRHQSINDKAHLNISQLVIEEAISNAGHDTQNKKAQDSAYVNLLVAASIPKTIN